MKRPNVIAYSVAAIFAAVLVLGAFTMIRVVGFNTDLDFSVETVDEYARWCGRLGDPVAVVVAACGWPSPPVQPSPVTNAVSAESQTTPETLPPVDASPPPR